MPEPPEAVVVYDQRFVHDEPPMNLIKFMEWLGQQADKIPAKFLSEAHIELVPLTTHGMVDVHVRITYLRPEGHGGTDLKG